MDNQEKDLAFQKYGPEIAYLLKNENNLPVLPDHIVNWLRIREDTSKDILAEVPIPPGIQNILTAAHKIHCTLEILKLCKMEHTSLFKELEVKLETFKDIFTLWLGEFMIAFPAFTKRLEDKRWSASPGHSWMLLFVVPKGE